MLWQLLLMAWLMLLGPVAILLGRSIREADRREVGDVEEPARVRS